MKKLAFGILILLSFLSQKGYGQQTDKGLPLEQTIKDSEMQLRVDCFERIINEILSGSVARAQLDPFMMSDTDVDFWMSQFVFTEEVLKEISREAFYNRLQGWAGSARQNFITAISGMGRFEVAEVQFKYGDDPNLLVSSSANLLIHLFRGEDFAGSLHLTLLDIQGQLKFIQVN